VPVLLPAGRDWEAEAGRGERGRNCGADSFRHFALFPAGRPAKCYRYCKNKPYPKSRYCRGVPDSKIRCAAPPI
jgi:hypothetical protein